MLDSTVLTIGTALRRAQNAGMSVEVLVHGQWICGHVLGLDGHGAFLEGDDGDSAVVRLEDVCVVKVHPAAQPHHGAAAEQGDDEAWRTEARIRAHAAPADLAALG
jgi:hypothetical protein